MATNITSKGQVTVPKKIRDYLGLKPGAAVTFERLASGAITLRAAGPGRKPQPSKFAKLRGSRNRAHEDRGDTRSYARHLTR